MENYWWLWAILGVLLTAFVVFAFTWKSILASVQSREVARAVSGFAVQREQLEAKFFDLAASLGMPRDMRWKEIEWLEGVTYARDTESGLLTAFAAVNLRFEAVEGGDMEDVEAVGMVREAAAIFHFQGGRWGTGGRALFNMNPADAVTRLQGQFESVET